MLCLPFLTGPGVEGVDENDEKGGLTGTGGRAVAGTDWLRVLTGLLFMMFWTIWVRDLP